jgi:hypothetical protein
LPPESTQDEVAFALECVECGTRDERGRDWRAYVTSDDDLLVYCDICAEREFGA